MDNLKKTIFSMDNLRKIIFLLISYIILTFSLSIYDLKNNTYIMTYLVCIFGMAIGTLLSYISYKKSKNFKFFHLIITICLFSYFIANLLDTIISNYTISHLSNVFYLICSMGLAFSIWYLVFKLSSKWELIYISLNTFLLSIFIVYIAWSVFLEKIIINLNVLELDSIFSIFFLINAFIMILGLLILFQICEFTLNIIILSLGFQIYSITELVYYYLTINNIVHYRNYFLVLITSLGWELGLLLLSVLSLYIVNSNFLDNINLKNELKASDIKERTPISISIMVLALISICISDHILRFLLFILILIFRRISLRYIHTYLINEQLNKTLNQTLDDMKSKNQELHTLAYMDPLTGIPNRRNFVEYIDNLLTKNDSTNKFALLFLDLDRFKSINDWYGHDIGDKLLIATCERLKENISSNDFIARQGGDEFIIILNNLKDESEAIEKSNILVESFRKPILLDNMNINSSISIGISMYPINSTIRSDLMTFSDIALYNAKNSGKNTSCLYSSCMKRNEIRKLELENKLYNSISNNELLIYYQPQFDIKTGELIGIEALSRWNNADLGFVPPSEFIPIAEDNGFIINIGDWVLENACKDIKYLNNKYSANIKVGINVSPKQFIASNLHYNLKNYINKYNLRPHWIDIEITENCSVKNEEKTLEKLLSLKKLGVHISIDDFGTGYSSFIYLKRYPITTLKIAKELVSELHSNIENYNIIKAIIYMCHNLGLNVIAEGVETQEQLDILESLDCHEVQGFYFAKPMTLEELEESFFAS